MKLNIGAGDERVEGYENVDLYHEGAEYAWEMGQLHVPDRSVEAIRAVHCLEHVGHFEVPAVLGEWHRVLETEGTLQVEVPDLDYVCAFWLRREDPAFALEMIFGHQRGPGQIHMTGFDETSLRQVLTDAYFEVQVLTRIWSHGQQSLLCKALAL